jgi:3'(2'), 5'-bisphosphate nucleotidase
MDVHKKKELLELCIHASLVAGKAILEIYNSDFSVEHKDDKSPLTEADKQSHLAIVEVLKGTNIPILSEEGRDIPYEERKDWEYFWMIDPLDGTKEFVKRNGEFTVNIALIHQQQAIMGIIYVPVKDSLYAGAQGIGSFKIDGLDTLKDLKIETLLKEENKLPKKLVRKYTIVGSRSHMSAETEEFIAAKRQEQGEIEMISVGSSLKLCMVAEGIADDYPRFAPTMEWDTAAGQAIVEAMGGKVIDWETKASMKYNRKDLLNKWFLVTKD